MAVQNEQAVINLVVNGRAAEASLRDIRSAISATTSSIAKMNEADNPRLYQERQRALAALIVEEKNRKRSLQELIDAQDKVKKSGKSMVMDIAGGNILANMFQKGVAMAKEFVAAMISSAAQTQKFTAILTNALGSKSEAQKSLNMLRDWAATTPESLESATQGYIKLINRGIKPTKDEMTAIGDVAASQGKSMDQYIEAILDGMTGENERLKELGITARTTGNTVEYTFRGMTVAVNKFDKDAIKNTLINFGKMNGVANTMKSVAETIEGQQSNLNDNTQRLAATIGTNYSGAIMAAYKAANFLVGKTQELVEIPLETKLRNEQLELNTLVGAIVSTNENQAVRNSLIAQLNQKYPEFLGNISSEASRNEVLLRRLEDVNNQYRQKILIAANEKTILEKQEKLNGLIEKEGKARMEIAKAAGLTAKELAGMSDKEIESLALSLKNKAQSKIRFTGSMTATSGTSNEEAKAWENYNIVISAKKEQQGLFKELNDLTSAGAILNAKLTAERVAQIDIEIAKLKEKKGMEAEITRLTEEKNQLLGIKTKAKIVDPNTEKEAENAAKKLLKETEKYAEEIKKLKDDVFAQGLEDQDKEVFAVMNKYQKLKAEAKKYGGDLNQLTELESQEIFNINKKWLDKQVEEEKKAAEEKKKIKDDLTKFMFGENLSHVETESKQQKDLDELGGKRYDVPENIKSASNEKYNQMQADLDLKWQTEIDNANKIGQDTFNLEQLWAVAKSDLRMEQYISEQQAAQDHYSYLYQQELQSIDKKRELATSITNIMSNMFTAIAGDAGQYTAFGKALTMTQIIIDSAAAISSVTAKNAATSLTPIDYAIKVAAAIATVMANIGRARQVLSQAQPPKAPKFAEGGFTDLSYSYNPSGYVTTPTFFQKGPKSFIAGEAGAEWIAPNWMLQNPATANIIGMLEALRSGTPVFASGGFSDKPTATTSTIDILPLIAEVRAMRMELSAYQERPINFNISQFNKANDFMNEIFDERDS